MKDIEALADFVNIVLPFKPESLETFDDATLKLAIKFMPEIAKKIHRSYFSLVFSFWREGLMTFIHGLPKFVVLVEITEDEESVLTDKIAALVSEFKKRKVVHTVMHSEAAGEKYWTVRRESFNLLRKKVKGKHATAFIDDFVIQPKYLPKFLPELKKILNAYDITPTFAGHAGSGNFHIIPLMDLSRKEERDKIHPVSQKVYALINKYKGSITAEHNDGLVRSPYLEGMYGKKIMKLFERTKDIFDPQGIFNPGKKVYSDIEFALAHIKKSV